ncbi:MAG: phosphatase PAP2 family protein [Acidimicrobiia bacterium]
MADERGENLSNVVDEARLRVVAADEIVFRAVAGYHSPILDRVLPDLSVAASYSRIWIALSGLLVAFGGKRGRVAAAEGLLSVAITSFLANLLLKRAVPRQRPKEPVPEARELPDPESSSFPSGHTASGAAYSSAVGHVIPQLWAPLNALAATIGFSRVYTGVHHPSDVAVGWVLGKGVAALVRRTHIVPKLLSRFDD